MRKLAAILGLIVAFTAGLFCGLLTNHVNPTCQEDIITIRDTIVDNIPFYQPIPIDSVVIRYDRIKLSVKDTIYIDRIHTDSVFVEIPIIQKEYSDSTYHAWVSGYHPNLDSIRVYSKTVYLTQKIKSPAKRWGLGVQLGVGYTDGRIDPYLGVGVHYNILNW